MASRVTREVWLERYAIRTEDGLIVHASPVTRIQSGARQRLQRRSGLELNHTGELPSVDHSSDEMLVVNGTGQIQHVRHVEDVRTVECQRPVIPVEVERIQCSPWTLAVVVIPVSNSQSMAPGIVCGEHRRALLLNPLRN